MPPVKECRAEVMLIGRLRSSMRGWLYLLGPVVACVLCAVLAPAALATGSEPALDVRIDPTPCLAASAANGERQDRRCMRRLIDNERTERADRIKALIARGGAYARKDMVERAIDDRLRAAARSGAIGHPQCPR
jgi:hypothetical protein